MSAMQPATKMVICIYVHHDQQASEQAAFAKDVKSLIAVFQVMGNPYFEKGQDLLVLGTRVEMIGKEKYEIS